MMLNEKDRDIYLKFIKSRRKCEDNTVYYYSSLIYGFINENYNSNDCLHYDLDDFIQEAYALIISKDGDLDDINSELNSLYIRMNQMGKVEYNNTSGKRIDINKYIASIEDEKEKEVLKSLLIDEDLCEKAKELNITSIDIKNIVIKLLNDLEKSIEENKVVYLEEDNNTKKR